MRSLIAMAFLTGSLLAQTSLLIKPAPPGFALDGNIGEWSAVVPTLRLNATPGARGGVVWVAQNETGIIVAGKVSGGEPHFPKSAATLLAGDHVEVWLSLTKPKFPPIGWGHQFGPQVLATEFECGKEHEDGLKVSDRAACMKWFHEQAPWREKLRRLFTYQYVIAPGIASEEFATPAYHAMMATTSDPETMPNLTKAEHDMFAAAQPPAAPRSARFAPTADGYGFEVIFPWESLPPAGDLELDTLSMMVDVFRAAPPGRKTGAYSTTSGSRTWGDRSSLVDLTLAQSRQYAISECGHAAATKDIYRDEDYPLYFRPSAGNVLNDTFFLHNTARGYQYDPAGMSPIVERVEWFGEKISPDEAVCGPQLAYKKGGKVIWSDFVLDKGFETKRLSDGTLLINDQPRVNWSYFGSGQCGACPRPGITIYRVKPGADVIDTALAWGDIVGNEVTDADIHVAPDWSKVTVFEQVTDYNKPDSEPVWRSETFCLQGNTYNSCEKKENVPEPKPRVLKGLDAPGAP